MQVAQLKKELGKTRGIAIAPLCHLDSRDVIVGQLLKSEPLLLKDRDHLAVDGTSNFFQVADLRCLGIAG